MPVLLRWLLRLGPTNPIAVRLVQNGSRRTKHLYIRAGYVAVLGLVLLWTLLVQAGSSTGAGGLDYRVLAAAGASSFAWVAYLQVGLICVLAPVFMASAIAQESNPKTWDIILTTPLTRAEIVLGNLFGRLFFVLALLFASLPLFALTQYFGGVPGQSILTSYLIAGCAATLVGAIAIALSVSRLAGRRAVFAFYVSVVSYLGATAAIDAGIRNAGLGASGGNGVTWMTALNPFLAMRALLEPSGYPRGEEGSYAGLAAHFLESPVTTWCVGALLLSVLLMGASTLTVRMGGLQTLGQGRDGVPWHRRLLKLGAADTEHRPPRGVWANPIAWREAAARNATIARMAARYSFIAIGGLAGVGLVVMYHLGMLDTGDFRFVIQSVVWTEVAVITLVAINMAATAISREREDGTLDLILTTPITPAMYLTGKLRGLVAYLIPLIMVPVATLGVAGIYALLGGLGRPDGGADQVAYGGTAPSYPWTGDPSAPPAGITPVAIPAVLPEAIVIAPMVLIPFIAFCVMVGLQWSLKSRGTIGSVVGTVGIVGAISGVIGLCAWNSGASIAPVGAVAAAVSPASLLGALVTPYEMLESTFQSGPNGLRQARVGLAIGAALAAAGYTAIVYGIHASMVKNFDFTVRKLAGTK